MTKGILLLKWVVKMFATYWKFDMTDFEFFEIDDSPDFYLMIITFRPKK